MIHELRIYHCAPGRLAALNHRFETITLKLWQKHGIRQAGFWTVLIGENNHDLFYHRREHSGGSVNTESRNIVGGVIGNIDELATRVDGD